MHKNDCIIKEKQKWFYWFLLWNSLPLWTHFLFDLRFDSFEFFCKALVIAIRFLSFKGTTHAYLLQISIKHNKNLNHLLNLLINCMSAKCAPPQMLCVKGKYTFLFSNFLIIGFCSFFANSLLEIISFLTTPPENFLQKICKPLNQVNVDIHHILDF